jgi:predicted Fe-Mo cluster-binding NifX family protein
MNKIIAIPSTNGVLDEHFGHCSQFTLFEIDAKNILNQQVIDAPPHEPGLLPPFLAEKGVTDVIAGGIGQRAIQIFNQHKINVYAGAPKLVVKELVDGFLNNTLQFSANYCDH